MNILIVSRFFPYPPRGGNVLPIYHFARISSTRHKVTLLTVEPDSAQLLQEARTTFDAWGAELITVQERARGRMAQSEACLRAGQWWINSFYLPELAQSCAALVRERNWDLIQAEYALSGQHVPSQTRSPRLLIARDSLALRHWRAFGLGHRLAELLQSLKIGALERREYRRFDRIVAISPVDREAMLRLAPRARIDVISNGVDLALFAPQPAAEQDHRVMFSGMFDAPANVDGALFLGREVWPLVRARIPGAKLVLVGGSPPAEMRALAADDSIELTGLVDSVPDHMARASLIVSPLRFGTGVKNKVLEGAAMGKAMVITSVSLEGISLQPGRDVTVADDAVTFAQAIVQMLEDPTRRRELGASARKAMEEQYAWERVGERLLAVYDEMARAGGGL